MKMVDKKEKNETWTIEELIALSTEVQQGVVTFHDKDFKFQYCELTEEEEPKYAISSSGNDEDDMEASRKVANIRMKAMIAKANKLNPEGATLTSESWDLLPVTIKYLVIADINHIDINKTENFRDG